MKYLSSFSFYYVQLHLLSAISSNIEDGNSIKSVVSNLKYRIQPHKILIDVTQLSMRKLLWKYDSNEFVSGDDTKRLACDPTRFTALPFRTGTAYNLCLKRYYCWTGIENRQTRIFFNPSYSIITSIPDNVKFMTRKDHLLEHLETGEIRPKTTTKPTK